MNVTRKKTNRTTVCEFGTDDEDWRRCYNHKRKMRTKPKPNSSTIQTEPNGITHNSAMKRLDTDKKNKDISTHKERETKYNIQMCI